MKKLLVLMLTLILAANTFSQDSSKYAMQKAYYRQAKNQKTTAWVLLGGGAAMIVTGIIIMNSGVYEDNLDNAVASVNTGGLLVVVGGLAGLASIPFFIASGNNNRRAAEISFGAQQIRLPVNGSLALKYTPALSIKIGLRKSGK